jgi:PAS domain S-box-containing protein
MLPGRLDRPLLILVVLILAGMGFSSYWNWIQVRETMAQWTRARQLLNATNELIIGLTDAETGQRGYLLTGLDSYLEPFTKANAEIPGLIDQMIKAAGAEQPAAGQAKLLAGLARDKVAELHKTIALRREQGLDAAIETVRTHQGKLTMDSIRTLGESMTTEAENSLAKHRQAVGDFAFRSLWLTITGLAGLLLVTVFLQQTVDRGIQVRDQLAGDLDQAKQKLEVTLMSIGDGVIASDEKGRVTLMNTVAEELTGWTRHEAEGLPVDTIFHIVNEETRAIVESPVAKVLRTGVSASLANHTVLIGKQGQKIPIDDSGAAIRDRSHQLLGVVLVFRDITKRRAQEIQIDKWQRIFQKAGFGVAILVNDGQTILEVNSAFAAMHGYDADELRGKSFAELVDGESNYEKARGEDHSVYEALHKRKDGGSFHVVTDMTVFRNGAGEPVFRAAYFADISDRRRAELELRHSEERFRAAAEAMGDVIWTSNSKGEMVGEQPGWAAFSGQSFEEYQGFGAWKVIHTDDRALLDAWEQSLAQSRKFSAEIRMRRHDGQYRLMSTTAVPLFNEDATVREWVGALTDITALRQGQEEVRESDERFQGLATAFPQLVWSSKPDGNLEYANSLWREYTGPAHESAAERPFWDEMIHPEDAGPHMERWRESMASGKMFESQARLRRAADGSYRWFICRAVPVRGRDHRIVRWLGACSDINDQMNYAADLRLTNEALQRSNADLEQFAYAASHDLQEPLRMISLYTQLLQEEYTGLLDETGRSYVDFAVSGAQRMERLLQDLMAYSRVSAEPAVRSEISDASAALEAALGNLEAAVRKSGAQFHIGELPLVEAPSVHLVLLFQNLIGNALKYSGGQVPEVWIDARPVDKFWQFSVRDNGMGIEPQYGKQIFGIFKRLHGAEYEGTGIGLAVCQRIVERTGGRIWLESTPGEGSTFYFTLPRVG